MLSVSPIKDQKVIDSLKSYFLQSNCRDYLFFVISINLPFKLNEIVTLRVKDVVRNEQLKTFHVQNYEISLPDYICNDLLGFIQKQHLSPDDYLFQSIKTKQPLTRQQVYRIIHEAVTALQIDTHIGIQSLKKTFAFHAYMHHMDIYALQNLLGHQSKYDTYKFIEIEPPTTGELRLNL
ncbi:tyrosine-type recombinase/integrase [Macrococcus lamae]|uniref:Integrase n=1 Tax=Macrococcus lamae TaxID=198484 RepID=A0A4R6BX00_9STAP|nr:tyrosine-type recombinase/integrase [Macrococcus lamae]TDM12753.1 integrase [Macrococcus lamae]